MAATLLGHGLADAAEEEQQAPHIKKSYSKDTFRRRVQSDESAEARSSKGSAPQRGKEDDELLQGSRSQARGALQRKRQAAERGSSASDGRNREADQVADSRPAQIAAGHGAEPPLADHVRRLESVQSLDTLPEGFAREEPGSKPDLVAPHGTDAKPAGFACAQVDVTQMGAVQRTQCATELKDISMTLQGPAESAAAGLDARLHAIEEKLDLLLSKADRVGDLGSGQKRAAGKCDTDTSAHSCHPEPDRKGKLSVPKREEKFCNSVSSTATVVTVKDVRPSGARTSRSTSSKPGLLTMAQIAQRIQLHEKKQEAEEREREATASRSALEQHEKRPSIMPEWLVWLLDDPNSSKAALWLNKMYQFFILSSVLAAGLSGVENKFPNSPGITALAVVIELVFLFEVVLRLLISPRPIIVSYTSNLHNWFDLMAIVPLSMRVYVASAGFSGPLQGSKSVLEVFILCVVPILRLLKLLRHFETFQLLVRAIFVTSECLPMLLYTMTLLSLVFSGALYLVEPQDNIESWQHAIWFSIVTMTTVGYGDVSPTTTAGYVVTTALIVTGLLFMAIPIGIIGSSIQDNWASRDKMLLIHRTHAALRRWEYGVSDIQDLFGHIDSTGAIPVGAFTQLLKEMKIGISDDRIQALFDHLDKDHSGRVHHADFIQMVFPSNGYLNWAGPATSESHA